MPGAATLSHDSCCSPTASRETKKSEVDDFRPGLVKAAAFLAIAAALGLAAGCRGRGPRNVIFFIGDGMHLECEVAASRYLFGADSGLAWHAFPGRYCVTTWDVPTYNRYAWRRGAAKFDPRGFLPVVGYDPDRGGWEPYPAQSSGIDSEYFLAPLPGYGVPEGKGGAPPAPDSAAAATAMATGWKTDGGNIAWRPGDSEDGRLETILEAFRAERGGAIGAVSTVPFNHATPAAFIAHNPSRNHYYTGLRKFEGEGLADEIIRRTKPDVVIGGGHPHASNPDFDRTKGFISRELLEELRASADFVLAERRAGEDGARILAAAAEEARASGRKLFGLFGGERGDFDAPVAADAPGAPGFSRPSTEDPLLKDVVLAALDILGRNPRGFFLMAEQGSVDWANHDNDFRHMIGAMIDLEEAVKAAVAFVDRPGDRIDWENTLLAVVADHATGFLRLDPDARLGAGDLPRQEKRPPDPPSPPGTIKAPKKAYASPRLYPDGEVSYATSAHTNELVGLSVRGWASERFGAAAGRWYGGRILDNTQIYDVMAEALRLRAGRSRRLFPAAAASPEPPSAGR